VTDRFIAEFPATEDDDLMLCPAHGVAYQKDRKHIVNYDEHYYDKCLAYEGKPIADKINAGRIAIVAKHYGMGPLLDTGIGSGEFIKRRPNTYGRDVNPVAVEWLMRNDLWAHDPQTFHAFTFWDVLEHIETPEAVLQWVQPGAYLFTCIPVFEDLGQIRKSRHYRPGEHLYYFTDRGFVSWMALHDFDLLERDCFETKAGRESIATYAFQRMRPADKWTTDIRRGDG
jgi:hypothetical protein